MKQHLIILAFLFSTSVFAQKGSWYLGGMAGFQSTTNTNLTVSPSIKTVNNAWSVAPEFGTFLRNDIQLGFALGLSGSSGKVAGNMIDKTIHFDPTIYCRKTFKLTDNFKVFTGLYLNYTSGTAYGYTGGNQDSKNPTLGFGAKLGLGIMYSLSPRFTAVGQYGLFSFNATSTKDEHGNKVADDSGFNLGMNTTGTAVFNVGLYYTIKQ